MVTVVAPDLWWAPAWWIGHPDVDVYVNISTPAALELERVVCIDLDLDVIRFTDGRVDLVDRDEFELHQVQYGYPDDVVDGAEAAAIAAFDLVSQNEPPFDGVAARRWADRREVRTTKFP